MGRNRIIETFGLTYLALVSSIIGVSLFRNFQDSKIATPKIEKESGNLTTRVEYLENPIRTICPISREPVTIYKGSIDNWEVYRFDNFDITFYKHEEDFRNLKVTLPIHKDPDFIQDPKTRNAIHIK